MIKFPNSVIINLTPKATKHNSFMKVWNFATSKIKESKKENNQHYFQKYSKNVKKTWDGIKSIVTLKTKVESLPNALTLSGITTAKKKAIVDTFSSL